MEDINTIPNIIEIKKNYYNNIKPPLSHLNANYIFSDGETIAYNNLYEPHIKGVLATANRIVLTLSQLKNLVTSVIKYKIIREYKPKLVQLCFQLAKFIDESIGEEYWDKSTCSDYLNIQISLLKEVFDDILFKYNAPVFIELPRVFTQCREQKIKDVLIKIQQVTGEIKNIQEEAEKHTENFEKKTTYDLSNLAQFLDNEIKINLTITFTRLETFAEQLTKEPDGSNKADPLQYSRAFMNACYESVDLNNPKCQLFKIQKLPPILREPLFIKECNELNKLKEQLKNCNKNNENEISETCINWLKKLTGALENGRHNNDAANEAKKRGILYRGKSEKNLSQKDKKTTKKDEVSSASKIKSTFKKITKTISKSADQLPSTDISENTDQLPNNAEVIVKEPHHNTTNRRSLSFSCGSLNYYKNDTFYTLPKQNDSASITTATIPAKEETPSNHP